MFSFDLIKIPVNKRLFSQNQNSLIFINNISVSLKSYSLKKDLSNLDDVALCALDLTNGETIWSLRIGDIYKYLNRPFLLRGIKYSKDLINIYFSSIEKVSEVEVFQYFIMMIYIK